MTVPRLDELLHPRSIDHLSMCALLIKTQDQTSHLHFLNSVRPPRCKNPDHVGSTDPNSDSSRSFHQTTRASRNAILSCLLHEGWKEHQVLTVPELVAISCKDRNSSMSWDATPGLLGVLIDLTYYVVAIWCASALSVLWSPNSEGQRSKPMFWETEDVHCSLSDECGPRQRGWQDDISWQNEHIYLLISADESDYTVS